MLAQLLACMDEHEADILLLAGDIYDSKQPPSWAIALLDEFLTELAHRRKQLVMIGGNHDPLDRLGFCSKLLHDQGLHIYTEISESAPFVSYGSAGGGRPLLTIWPIPFIRANSMRAYAQGECIENTHDAVSLYLQRAYDHERFKGSALNFACAHQFVVKTSENERTILSPELSDSERACLGTLDAVEERAFFGFDYVALGHIHKAQRLGEKLQYSGSPLVYSFSEAKYQKSVMKLSVSADQEGVVFAERIELASPRVWKELTGSYSELMQEDCIANYQDCYLRLVLTDTLQQVGVYESLRGRYPYLMQLDYEFIRRRSNALPSQENLQRIQSASPLDLFKSFYQEQQACELSADQVELVRDILQELNIADTPHSSLAETSW